MALTFTKGLDALEETGTQFDITQDELKALLELAETHARRRLGGR